MGRPPKSLDQLLVTVTAELRRLEELVQWDPHNISTSEQLVHHATNKYRLRMTVPTEASPKPEPRDGWTKPPPPKLPRVYRKLRISGSHLERHAHVHPTGPEDQESMEAEPKD